MKISDPVSFLRNLTAKKGVSDLYGVHLNSVTVVADSKHDYEYDVVGVSPEKLMSPDRSDWDRLLVTLRTDTDAIVFPISFHVHGEPITVYFLPESTEMSCMVFIPQVLVDEFAAEVVTYQRLLRYVAEFCGKYSTFVRFTLGSVTIEWDDLVEQGGAKEVVLDVGW